MGAVVAFVLFMGIYTGIALGIYLGFRSIKLI